MITCKVIGNVWATRKDESLNGLKLMIVRRTDIATEKEFDSFVAVDCVGAGIGEAVLVTLGSSAREAFSNLKIPVDAVIIGIIDGSEC
jgi:ethanolamine utilization protein EutN